MEETRAPETISYYVHEAEIARTEAHSKRWAVAALISFIALVLSNMAWVIYEVSYQDVMTVTQEADAEDGAEIYQSGTGGLSIDGKSETDSR